MSKWLSIKQALILSRSMKKNRGPTVSALRRHKLLEDIVEHSCCMGVLYYTAIVSINDEENAQQMRSMGLLVKSKGISSSYAPFFFSSDTQYKTS